MPLCDRARVSVTPQHGITVSSSGEVRRATVADIDALIEMGRAFLAYSAYGKSVPFDRDQMAIGLCSILDSGVIFVAEKDAKIIGCIVGIMNGLWFAKDTKVAAELAWWVAPEYRGGRLSIKLLREFERWGVEQGVKHIVMSDMVIDGEMPVARLFEKLGYALVERAHMKGV